MSVNAKDLSSINSNVLRLIRSEARTDQGVKRNENQDSFGILENEFFKFFMVADGMGGARGGAVASDLAVSTVTREFANSVDITALSLRDAILNANREVFKKSRSEIALRGMGTTVCAVVVTVDKLLIANVGDSRLYRIRNGNIDRLTEDHTLAAELERASDFTTNSARDISPVSHILTRSIGTAADVEVDIFRSEFFPKPGDRFVLCSDGLYGMVEDDEILKSMTAQPLEASVDELIDLANINGGVDNITVVAFEVTQRSGDCVIDETDTLMLSRQATIDQISEGGEVVANDYLTGTTKISFGNKDSSTVIIKKSYAEDSINRASRAIGVNSSFTFKISSFLRGNLPMSLLGVIPAWLLTPKFIDVMLRVMFVSAVFIVGLFIGSRELRYAKLRNTINNGDTLTVQPKKVRIVYSKKKLSVNSNNSKNKKLTRVLPKAKLNLQSASVVQPKLIARLYNLKSRVRGSDWRVAKSELEGILPKLNSLSLTKLRVLPDSQSELYQVIIDITEKAIAN